MHNSSLSVPGASAGVIHPKLRTRPWRSASAEPHWLRLVLSGTALLFLTLFLFIPLALVFVEAFKQGTAVYLAAITNADAL
ncbi:MAG: hypothetical protein RLZZ09_1516, partial [Pseudomonadota bacterium]